jgi:hypothetical protein
MLLRSFFTDNVNSILAAISVHLLVVLIFLWFKLGQMDEMQKDQVLVEFNEVIQPEEQQEQNAQKQNEQSGEDITSLDRRTLQSIASNVAGKLDKQISTTDYEKEVMNELGISSLKSPGAEMEKEASEKQADENAIDQPPPTDQEKNLSVPNIIRKDNTTVSYFLEGRWHKYIYIPTYKCQGGGTVLMDIIIGQSGKVISAIIQENKSTPDPCLREEAYRSAISAQFNSDSKASTKQLGTMTYVFLAQ